MIIGLANSFPADAVERAVPDVDTAWRLVDLWRPDVRALLGERRELLLGAFGAPLASSLARCEDAIALALARFGLRHGSWGRDYHHYHNENHALELLDNRLGRVLAHAGVDALEGEDWLALALFAACHDLRQRERLDFSHPIGNNEAASIAETTRILQLAGFTPARDRPMFVALELMIAGSTFDARPAPVNAPTSPAELAASGGALAPKLAGMLDRDLPDWRRDADRVRAVSLALIASDLDTANVAEPLPWLAESAVRLCQEREMRAGRDLETTASAAPCANFLSDGQERYFFDLHRFCSELGRSTFETGKQANAGAVRDIAARMRTQDFARGCDALRNFSALALARA